MVQRQEQMESEMLQAPEGYRDHRRCPHPLRRRTMERSPYHRRTGGDRGRSGVDAGALPVPAELDQLPLHRRGAEAREVPLAGQGRTLQRSRQSQRRGHIRREGRGADLHRAREVGQLPGAGGKTTEDERDLKCASPSRQNEKSSGTSSITFMSLTRISMTRRKRMEKP